MIILHNFFIFNNESTYLCNYACIDVKQYSKCVKNYTNVAENVKNIC